MKLERLTIQGFKSFKDRTTIVFDHGVTGIVGPNGCGKSNIVDALFWVMGEQSAKHLRGEKMSDLIFNGTDKYSQSAFAEVSLVLENTHHKHIHIGQKVVQPSEIELTRKLYRNGETEYRINGTPARLKDIQEVFMDTGAGAKSYSVIAQGEIDRLVKAKPEDRRYMIDEVAGITKFKTRRKESLKKLEQTQQNLDRLSDLQKEISKQLENLEEQAHKARKAKQLREKVKHHELIVQSHKEHDYIEKLMELQEKAIKQLSERQIKETEKTSIEVKIEDDQLKKIELMEQVEFLHLNFSELSLKVAKGEEQLKFLQKSIEEKNELIAQKVEEYQQQQLELVSRQERLAQIQTQLEELHQRGVESVDTSSLEEEVAHLQDQVQEHEDELKDLRKNKSAWQEKWQVHQQEAFKHKSRLEEMSRSLQELSIEIDALETQSSNFNDNLDEKRRKLLGLEKIVQDQKEFKETLQKEFTLNKNEILKLEQLNKTQNKEVVALESKLSSMEELRFSAFEKKGAERFLKSHIAESGNLYFLGTILDFDLNFKVPMQRTFQEFESILLAAKENQEISKTAVIQWAMEQKESIDLALVDTLESMSICDFSSLLEKFSNAEILPISSLAKISEPSLAFLTPHLLEGRFIVKHLSLEQLLNHLSHVDIPFKSIVDMDGTFLVSRKAGMIVVDVLHPHEKQTSAMGLIERNAQIQLMKDSLFEKQSALNVTEDKLLQLTQHNESLGQQILELQEQYQKNSDQFIAIKSELLAQENSFQFGASRLEILKNKKFETSRSRLDLLENDDHLEEFEEELQNEIKKVDNAIISQEEVLLVAKNNLEEKKQELYELKAHAKTFEGQLKNYSAQIKDIEDQIVRLGERSKSNLEQQTQIKHQLNQHHEEIKNIKNENAMQVESLHHQEEELTVKRDDLQQILLKLQKDEQSIKDLSQAINKIDKDLVESQLKLEQILVEEQELVRLVLDADAIDLRASLVHFLNPSLDVIQLLKPLDVISDQTENAENRNLISYVFEKKFPGQVKESQEKFRRYRYELNNIGEINWNADSDYERQKVRFDFLNQQEAELKKSLDDLHEAIRMIDEKSVVRFKLAYEEINDKFSKVFPIIFGGGHACLQLTSNMEDPECGVEIIAQPPGKKMQSINLMSGGEKALTAVSLIFSIFLVKPSPFCLLDEVDAPLDDANVGRFNELLKEMSHESQFVLITHNKKTMELNDTLYGITMQEPGVSKALSVQLH